MKYRKLSILQIEKKSNLVDTESTKLRQQHLHAQLRKIATEHDLIKWPALSLIHDMVEMSK